MTRTDGWIQKGWTGTIVAEKETNYGSLGTCYLIKFDTKHEWTKTPVGTFKKYFQLIDTVPDETESYFV